ncbi:MAG: arsenate reductase (glutaredoxin) [Hyphomicrobiaceae bacterium]
MAKGSKADEVVIYHNPRCGKSRATLALIREAGIEPRIVEYLKTPPSRTEVADLARRMKLPLADLIRGNEAAFAEHDLGRAGITDEAILDAIAAHPILLNRPIVATAKGVRLCRPPELVKDILPAT